MKIEKIVRLLGYLLVVAGIFAVAAPAYAQESKIDDAIVILFELIEGSFGALVMVVAGLVAIVAASMGMYRAGMSALVVAIGAFILRTMVELFFPGSGGG